MTVLDFSLLQERTHNTVTSITDAFFYSFSPQNNNNHFPT